MNGLSYAEHVNVNVNTSKLGIVKKLGQLHLFENKFNSLMKRIPWFAQ